MQFFQQLDDFPPIARRRGFFGVGPGGLHRGDSSFVTHLRGTSEIARRSGGRPDLSAFSPFSD